MMSRYDGRYPVHPFGPGGTAAALLAVPSRGRNPNRNRNRRRSATVAAAAARAARVATYRCLGAAVAARSTWEGRSDGTATGVVEGLPVRWVGSGADPGRGALTLRRRCQRCGASWTDPVRSEGQMIRAVIEDQCGCARCRWRQRRWDAAVVR